MCGAAGYVPGNTLIFIGFYPWVSGSRDYTMFTAPFRAGTGIGATYNALGSPLFRDALCGGSD